MVPGRLEDRHTYLSLCLPAADPLSGWPWQVSWCLLQGTHRCSPTPAPQPSTTLQGCEGSVVSPATQLCAGSGGRGPDLGQGRGREVGLRELQRLARTGEAAGVPRRAQPGSSLPIHTLKHSRFSSRREEASIPTSLLSWTSLSYTALTGIQKDRPILDPEEGSWEEEAARFREQRGLEARVSGTGDSGPFVPDPFTQRHDGALHHTWKKLPPAAPGH